jgi:hypothetical protein
MSSLFKNFKMDHDKELHGVKVTPASANEDGTVPVFILARMGQMNQTYLKTLERITNPYKRQLELKTIAPDKADELMREVFVNSILLGWENVQGEEGSIIPFSAANAIALFKQLPDLYFELQTQSQNAALFRLEETESIAKN